jgi:hypothetical protein
LLLSDLPVHVSRKDEVLSSGKREKASNNFETDKSRTDSHSSGSTSITISCGCYSVSARSIYFSLWVHPASSHPVCKRTGLWGGRQCELNKYSLFQNSPPQKAESRHCSRSLRILFAVLTYRFCYGMTVKELYIPFRWHNPPATPNGGDTPVCFIVGAVSTGHD